MTEYELLTLIHGGENIRVEFKKSTNEITRDVYDTVCSFSNRDGGIIILGVKDTKMANRERKNELKIYLSDDEQYILEQKVKTSGMKSKSAFLRRQILYGFIYDIDYSELREYNATLGRIGNNLNQIAKRMNATGNVYAADVKEVKELMKKVWDTQKSMLSKQPYMKQ